MTSFEQELIGSCGFSFIPLDGLSAVISVNSRLLLPSKSVLVYARKQSRSAIFEWVKEHRGWFWHVGNYLAGWEKRVKVINISMPTKKSSTQPKSAKKGDDSSEACSDIVPFESNLPPIGKIVLESSPLSFACTCFSRRPTANKPKPIALRSSTDAPPSSRTRGNKRKTSPPPVSTTTKRSVCYL